MLPTSQRMPRRPQYIVNLTRRMTLGSGLTAVYVVRLFDFAIAVDDCGTFRECDGLARLTLRDIGLH